MDSWCVVFVKQKTAYEVRISDWSSDVCSSDLIDAGFEQLRQRLMQVRKSGLAAAVAGERQHVVLAAQRIADERGEVAARADFEEHAETILVEPLHEIGRASCRESVCQYV